MVLPGTDDSDKPQVHCCLEERPLTQPRVTVDVVEMGVSRERTFPRRVILESSLKSDWSFQAKTKGTHFSQHPLGKILKAGESKNYLENPGEFHSQSMRR